MIKCIINNKYNIDFHKFYVRSDKMPGYMTHYIFGKLEYKKLQSATVKKNINHNMNVYHLGLQGPDIFFYFPRALLISRKNLGSMMHKESTEKYIEKMLKFVMNIKDEHKKEIAIAYFAGFMGHYCMDVVCHPYIYYRTDVMHKNKLYHGKHVALETDIDYLLTQKYMKRKSSDIHYGKLIRLTDMQCEVIAKMLTYICTGTYKDINLNEKIAKYVIKNMSYVINIINEKDGRIKGILSYITSIVDSITNIEPLFINDNYQLVYSDPLNLKKRRWYNPWEENSIEQADIEKSTSKTISEKIEHNADIDNHQVKNMDIGKRLYREKNKKIEENICIKDKVNSITGKMRQDNFFDLMSIASEMYQKYIIQIIDSVENGNRCEFIKNVGNKSLQTGLEI